jgi:hypothetical protein
VSDYRDPKVTTPRRTRSQWTWIGILVAVLVVALLVWWLWPDDDVAVVDEPPAPEATQPRATQPEATPPPETTPPPQ